MADGIFAASRSPPGHVDSRLRQQCPAGLCSPAGAWNQDEDAMEEGKECN